MAVIFPGFGFGKKMRELDRNHCVTCLHLKFIGRCNHPMPCAFKADIDEMTSIDQLGNALAQAWALAQAHWKL